MVNADWRIEDGIFDRRRRRYITLQFSIFIALALAAMILACFGCEKKPAGEHAGVLTPSNAQITTHGPEQTPTELPTAAVTPAPTPEPTPEPTRAPDYIVENYETLAALLAAPDTGEKEGTEGGNEHAADGIIIALGADISNEADGLNIGRPCTVRLEGHILELAGAIHIETQRQGTVKFENGTLRSGGLTAAAPGISLDTLDATCELAGETAPDGFYRWLKAVNETAALDADMHVHNEEELSALLSGGTYPNIFPGATLRLDFAPPEDTFTLPYIDLPENSLIWEKEGAPDAGFAASYFNVKAYNGAVMAEYGLGGKGYARLEKIDFKADSGLSGRLPWVIKGNTVSLQVPLHVSEDYMKYARLEFEAEGGSVTLNPEAVNGDGSIYLTRLHSLTVTDGDGLTRTYSVEIKRRTGSIPIVWIETEDGKPIESQEDYLRCRVAVTNTTSWGFATVPYTDAGIRGRGNSTWKWEKKPWRIKFDSGVSIFGLRKAKDWVLLANYADKSLIRNTVAFDMARGLSFDFVPHQYPVDVYLNGEYQGVYSIGEQIERNQERVDIDLNYEDPDTGYLLEVCGTNEDDVRGVDYFHAGKLIFVAIKSPDTKKMTPEHFKFISEYVQAADKAVQALGDYYEYVDAGTLYDWIIMCELTCNIDTAFRRSCFLTKEKGGKLKFGPLWDFDLAMGNFSRDYGDYESWAATGREYVGDTWFTFLLNDPKFTEPFKARWLEVRDDIMARAMDSIDRWASIIDYSQQENFIRWPILDKQAGYQPKSMKYVDTFEKQIQFLRDWLTARAAWMDEAIGAL